ncbi:hypothetical protein GF325_05685 [Candidatus Bathyarchaeota archaeon]|nr:hypothetical protein [Candidatus Bathyarchaeota archaeon]
MPGSRRVAASNANVGITRGHVRAMLVFDQRFNESRYVPAIPTGRGESRSRENTIWCI